MAYIALRKRIYDLVHAREYIPEIERWDPLAKREFHRIRYALKCFDEKKDPLSKFEPSEARSFQRAVRAELNTLQQYCRKKDAEDRLQRVREQEELNLAKRKARQNIPTREAVLELSERIGVLEKKLDLFMKEISVCVKTASSKSSKPSRTRGTKGPSVR